MNFNFYYIKLIAFIIIVLLLIVALIFIFFKPSSPPATNENNNCHQTNLSYQDPAISINERVTDLINRMTVAEKIGQMVLVEKNSIHDLNDITQYNLGVLLSFELRNSFPFIF